MSCGNMGGTDIIEQGEAGKKTVEDRMTTDLPVVRERERDSKTQPHCGRYQ